MKNLLKLSAFLAATLLVTGPANAIGKSVSDNISHAPTIVATYDQVKDDLVKHKGVNVRWGGQVIGTESVDKATLVSLQAYPLDTKGRPHVLEEPVGKVFVVKFNENNLPKRLKAGNFITVYGAVAGSAKLVNGPLESTVPVVASLESKKWKSRNIVGLNNSRNYVVGANRFGLGNRVYINDRFGFAGSRFGFRNNRFGFRGSRFGFRGSKFGIGGRGFSKFRGFRRF